MSYTPHLPQKFIDAWNALAAFFPPNWTAMLVCLAVWTFGFLWLVLRPSGGDQGACAGVSDLIYSHG